MKNENWAAQAMRIRGVKPSRTRHFFAFIGVDQRFRSPHDPRAIMKRPAKSNRRLHWWLHLGLVPIGWMSAGCCCPGGGLGSKCEDIPKGAIPPPLGTHLNEIDNA